MATQAEQQDVVPVSRQAAAAAGSIAALVALGVGELIAGLSHSAHSLVVAVGDVVVDYAPTGVTSQAIDIFGQGDKPALLIGIVLLSVVFGALLGVASITRRWVGVVGFAAFGILGAWAGMRNPMGSDFAGLVTAAVAAIAGIGTLLVLLAAAKPRPAPARGRFSDEPAPGFDRRGFVVLGGAAAIFGVLSGVVGRRLGTRDQVGSTRAAIDLRSAPQEAVVGVESQYPGLAPLITPNDDFYRIDTALEVPQVDPAEWRLRISGMVDDPFEITFDELLERPLVTETVTLSCVSNKVGGKLVGNAVWLGTSLRDILAEAGVQDGATQLVGRSVDDFTVGFPTAVLDDDRPALVAVGMNGEPLPAAHGFPARLVVAGLYGYVSATKWLTEIELTTLEAFDAYWIPRGWAKVAPIKTQSRIDVPRQGQKIPAGTTAIAGVAWAPHRGIDRVEVQIDGEPWLAADVGTDLTDNAWRQWVLAWDAPLGGHVIRVRATDGEGDTQTDIVRPQRPDGATGYHTIEVTVEEA